VAFLRRIVFKIFKFGCSGPIFRVDSATFWQKLFGLVLILLLLFCLHFLLLFDQFLL
jgi:hypothetical protein